MSVKSIVKNTLSVEFCYYIVNIYVSVENCAPGKVERETDDISVAHKEAFFFLNRKLFK